MADEAETLPAAQARELDIINEVMRRVHFVMAKYSETLERTTEGGGSGWLSATDSLAILKGATSGVAAFAARMDFQRNPAVNNDRRTPEEFVADGLRAQFVDSFRAVAAQDAVQAIASGAKPS